MLFSSDFRNDILEHKKDSGCKEIIMKNTESVMEIEMDNDNILLDVDTLEDYKRAANIFLLNNETRKFHDRNS